MTNLVPCYDHDFFFLATKLSAFKKLLIRLSKDFCPYYLSIFSIWFPYILEASIWFSGFIQISQIVLQYLFSSKRVKVDVLYLVDCVRLSWLDSIKV